MRLAVISDVHGNLAALEATLEHLDREAVDLIVVAGDLVNGAPDSLACWRLIRSLGYPLLRGNHERYLFDYGTPNERPEWRSERFGPVRWARARFTEEELRCMSELPLGHRIAEHPALLVVHAAPHADDLHLYPHTPEFRIGELLEGTDVELLVRGHNHLANSREAAGRLVITAGSVGMPLDGVTAAQFVLLERRRGDWRHEHRAVPYDVAATVRRFRESGYLEEAGPMARLLLREIATASHQLSPFMRYWQSVSPDGTLPLATAVDRFLNAY